MKREDAGRCDARDWARVTALIQIDDVTGCWDYTGYINPSGYGQTSTSKFGTVHEAYVHRIIYTFLRGAIQYGLQLDHTCRNRPCCNPAHLEPVTCKENLIRGVGLCAKNVQKTHCSQGHPLSGSNLRIKRRRKTSDSVYRQCRICSAVIEARAYQARKARRRDGSPTQL